MFLIKMVPNHAPKSPRGPTTMFVVIIPLHVVYVGAAVGHVQIFRCQYIYSRHFVCSCAQLRLCFASACPSVCQAGAFHPAEIDTAARTPPRRRPGGRVVPCYVRPRQWAGAEEDEAGVARSLAESIR